MDKTAVIFLWLLPALTSLHVFEKFSFPCGLKRWITSNKPQKPKSNFYYFIANASIIIGAFVIALKATDNFGYKIYLFIIGVLGWNALTHFRGTIQKKQYCLGVISGSLLTFPLMIASNFYFSGCKGVDLLSVFLFQVTGCFIGFYVGGMDIRKKDEATA
jgi:hypothetical protein